MEFTSTKTISLRRPESKLFKGLKTLLGRDWPAAYFFMFPTIILMGGIIAVPVVLAVYLSFTNTLGFVEFGAFTGLKNYVTIWQDFFFRTSVWITIEYTFWTVVFKLILGLGTALLLHRLKRFGTFLTGLVLIPWIMPEVVRAATWKGVLDPLFGLVNRFLLDFDFVDRAIPFFGGVETALPSVILVNVWGEVPFFTLILLAGLKAIDAELYEAAAIDGASAWRQFLHVTLPGLRYVIIVATLLSTIWTFNDFNTIFILTRGGPVGSTLVYSIRVYEAAQNWRFGVGAAMGMTVVPILGIFIVLLSRYIVAGNQAREVITTTPRRSSGVGRIVGRVVRAITWPFQMTLALGIKLFWFLNDAVERLVDGAAATMGRRFSGADRESGRNVRFVTGLQKPLANLSLFILLLFFLAPFYWLITTSFKTVLQITTAESVLWPAPWTLDNYRAFFDPDSNFPTWFGNTLLVSLGTSLLATFVGAFSAYGLTRLRWRGRSTFSALVLVTYLLPGVLLLIPLSVIFDGLGLIGSLWSLILAYPSFTLPFALWMMMGYYASIPEELEAAGLIDGCTRFQVFVRIVLPLAKPALMSIFLFSMIHAWGEFLFASLFFRDTMPVALARMILNGGVPPWGLVASTSILLAIPVFIMYAIGQQLMVEGLTAGAVKG